MQKLETNISVELWQGYQSFMQNMPCCYLISVHMKRSLLLQKNIPAAHQRSILLFNVSFLSFIWSILFLKSILMTSGACLLYTFDFLSKNLSKDSPIQCMVLFNQDIILQAKDCCAILCAQESDNYFPVSLYTGIPLYIITCVSQEKLCRKLDSKFEDYSANLIDELDKRQIGGNFTIELIHNGIISPIQEQLKALVTQVNDIQQPSHDVEGETCDTRTWRNEETIVRHQLLQDFVLNKCISSLQIMQLRHLGLS